VEVPLPPAFAAYVYVFEGVARVNDKPVKEGQFAVLGEGQAVRLAVAADAEQPAGCCYSRARRSGSRWCNTDRS
jgi:redox-sensitive bicupin YhaK (pirin superfamily)